MERNLIRGPYPRGDKGPLGFNPLSLSWIYYLQSDLGISLVGGLVDAWADQSGRGNHHTAPTSTNRCTYNAVDAVFNGYPSVQSDALLMRLFRAALSIGSTLGSFSWYIVACHNAVGNNAVIANYEPAFSIRCRSTSAGAFSGFMTGFNTLSTSLWRPTPRVIMYTWDGANQNVYVNNVLEGGPTVNATAAQADGAQSALFATSAGLVPINASAVEIGFKVGAFTAAERQALTARAITRYALP